MVSGESCNVAGVGKKANKLRVCGVRWGEDIFGGKLLEGLGP